MLRAGSLAFALGTLGSLTLNAGLAGCASTRPTGATQAGRPVADGRPLDEGDPCVPQFFGATKAAPILPAGCRRGEPDYYAPGKGAQQAPR